MVIVLTAFLGLVSLLLSLNQEKTKNVLNFLDTLEDDDDIQHVYANLETNNNLEKN